MYSSRIRVQKQRNPCLSDLYEFLQQPGPARDQSRIVCLDFFESLALLTVREISPKDLHEELKDLDSPTGTAQPDRKGQILLIEDISKYTIEELGTYFDIDPWFFASYIHQTWRKTRFLPLQYHRTVAFKHKDNRLCSLTRACNQQRKVVTLFVLGGQKIGLAQHCCSVLLVNRPERIWTGIILLDPPISNNYIPSERHGPLPSNLESDPCFGGCEDFSSFPKVTSDKTRPDTGSDRAMLDEFVHYWSVRHPPNFSASAPTLPALAYYPLKITAAEWVNYISVMGLTVREYEVSTSLSGDLVAELENLSVNLRILQGWRRRVLSTQAKMRRVLRFIKNYSDPQSPCDDWDALAEDYEFLSTEIEEHGGRLEAMVSLVASAAALIESQRSLAETANVTRLTVLAMVFVPFSFVAGLFSMSESFRPGGPQFWVYFAVAIPLAIGVGLVARPPFGIAKKLRNKFVNKITGLYLSMPRRNRKG